MKRRRPIRDLMTHERGYVTPPELAHYVDCDPRTVRRMIEAGSLVAFKVGRDWRIPTNEARRAFHVKRAS